MHQIGITRRPAYDKHQEWLTAISKLQAQTIPVMKKMIAALDESEGETRKLRGSNQMVPRFGWLPCCPRQ